MSADRVKTWKAKGDYGAKVTVMTFEMAVKTTVKTTISFLVGLAMVLGCVTNATAIVIDGDVGGFAEGYTSGYFVSFTLDDSSVRGGGELYLHEAGDIVYVGFTAPFTGVNAIVDNTWGDNQSQGWIDAGVDHDFEHLQKSDGWKWKNLEVTGGDDIKLELDYLADDNSKVALVKKAEQIQLGAKTDVSGAFQVASSLQYNLANNASAYQNDSFDFTSATDWLLGVSYEWSVDNSLIAGDVTAQSIVAGFGEFHMSPIMYAGSHSTTPEVGDPIPPNNVPEPTTLLLFGTGVAALAYRRRRKS